MTLEQFLTAVQKNAARVTEYKLRYDGGTVTKRETVTRKEEGREWTETIQHRPCDCIGLVIGAVRLCGEKWTGTHGSNYAARNRVTKLRAVSAASELALGDLVFKAANPGDSNYSLPSAYKNHPDQRDYYHVGVVTNISPLCITHCTGVAGGIKRDNTLGKWRFAGQLNMIKEEEDDPMTVDYIATVTAENGKPVNLRTSPSTKGSPLATVKVGTEVNVIEEVDAEWAKITTPGGKTGYMMRKFLKEGGEQTADDITIALPGDMAKALLKALMKAGVEA